MSLIGEERKRRILDTIEMKELATIQDLANRKGVSTETIRRYLEQDHASSRIALTLLERNIVYR